MQTLAILMGLVSLFLPFALALLVMMLQKEI
jgi:hypothetical protein